MSEAVVAENSIRRRSPVLASVIAAIGGLMFGYDTGIVGSAMLFVKKADQFNLNEFGQQAFVAVLLLGAVIAVLVTGNIADRIGRKKVLVIVGIMFIIGAGVNALTPNGWLWLLFLSRFVLGLAVGGSSLVVPLYIAEIAPSKLRGRLVSLNQAGVALGIFVAYLVGAAFADVQGWRQMIGVAVIPAIIMLIGIAPQPESPRWLALVGRSKEAENVLISIRSNRADADRELRDIRIALAEEEKPSIRQMFADLTIRRGIIIGVMVAAANQLVGVNAVLYYAPTILKAAGFDDSGAIYASTIIGFTGFVFTVIGLFLVDRIGRRPLLLTGIAVVVLTLIGLGALFLVNPVSSVATPLVIGFVLYEAVFCASLGIAIWLVNSEILPNRVRGKAQQFGTNTHWVLDFIISMTTLTLISTLTATGMFWMFAVFGIICFIVLWFILPETKGRTLEEIETELTQTVTGSIPEQKHELIG